MTMRIVQIAALVAAAGVTAACSERAPIAAKTVEASLALESGARRHDLRFACGDSECAAWLFMPAGETKPPVVVLGHGFAGTRDSGLAPFAEEFARRGIAALAFDYRHFGASGGAPRQLVDPWRQLEDWRAAVALARKLDQVDGKRLCVWGTSLGGGLALITGANDAGIACVVAQAPQIDSNAEGEATFPGLWWVIRLLLTAWGDLAQDAVGGDPVLIPAIAPSDGFAMIVDDRAFEAARKVVERGSTYRNAVAARSIFTFDDYNPAVQAAAIRQPVLLIASRADRFVPFAATEAFAKAHPNAALIEIEGEHFDIYVSPQREVAASAAGDFLLRHLAPSS